MAELTAQMVQQGRGAVPGTVAQRRRLAHDMRTAREKLTSSSGLERTFDYELVRIFAEYHVGSALVLLGLAAAIAAVATLWFPLGLVGIWLGFVAAALGLASILARNFLRKDPETVNLPEWRKRFALAELIVGLTWATAIQALAQVDGGTNGFVLFVAVMVAAVTAMLSATIPASVYLGIAPLGMAVLAVFATSRNLGTTMLVVMTASALLFFVVLANRLYGSALTTIRSRAEKDAMYAELQVAKANSDEARRRAEEANLAKSRFLATMSHELRTPLNAILGFSEVMQNEVFGPHASPSYKEYSADIHGSGQHLLTLINEILDLSRIEAGRYELSEEALQLAWIVSECRHMLTLRAKAKSQTIREHIDPSLPRLWADERAVRQIVLNVLSNAIKFTPQGGEIVIKVGWTSSGGQYVSVKDTGPGIPEEEIPVVMSSFGRGSLAIKTAEQGSGLGLPIVKGLVDLHGGGFQLRSKPREGTDVIVTFPAARVMDTLAPVDVVERRPATKAAA
ncbi:sensor histidine kinase [uncultured Enterovirga sp.]|uniref:sensor histidine kinase n=1 Tax=uncultured Enterovirga sp. TaxID=2026352 RepID=UPI0035CAEAC5